MNEQQVFNKWYLWNVEADASHEKKIPFIILYKKILILYSNQIRYDILIIIIIILPRVTFNQMFC